MTERGIDETMEMITTLGDLIGVAYTQSTNSEEKIEIPIVFEVPVSWINLITTLVPKDAFTVAELTLREFFDTGVVTFLKEMRQKYASPHDIIRKYEKLISE